MMIVLLKSIIKILYAIMMNFIMIVLKKFLISLKHQKIFPYNTPNKDKKKLKRSKVKNYRLILQKK